jgi:hypothetical protein
MAPAQMNRRLAGRIGRVETEGHMLPRRIGFVTRRPPRHRRQPSSDRDRVRIPGSSADRVAIGVGERIGQGEAAPIRAPDLGLPIGVGAEGAASAWTAYWDTSSNPAACESGGDGRTWEEDDEAGGNDEIGQLRITEVADKGAGDGRGHVRNHSAQGLSYCPTDHH